MKKQLFKKYGPNEKIPGRIQIKRPKPLIMTGVCRICGSPILCTTPKCNQLCIKCQMGVIKDR